MQNHKGDVINVKEFVAVTYDDQYYIGKVIGIKNKRVKLNFMVRTSDGQYQWPKRKDQETVGVESISPNILKETGLQKATYRKHRKHRCISRTRR